MKRGSYVVYVLHRTTTERLVANSALDHNIGILKFILSVFVIDDAFDLLQCDVTSFLDCR